MSKSTVGSVLTLLLVISSVHNVQSLRPLVTICPMAWATIANEVNTAIFQNRFVGAGLIRLIYHDCFVQGCDASILIDGPSTEKTAIPNTFFTNFNLIDQIKTAVDAVCGVGKVSCADIIATSAAISVTTLGGPFIDPSAGRYDGTTSNAGEAFINLPSPFSPLSVLLTAFDNKGLNSQDLVVLQGAHTVGRGHCGAFTNRLYNFNSTYSVDPTLDPTYAKQLQNACPIDPPFDPNTVVNMDTRLPTFFTDTNYFQDLQNKKGLFTSDAVTYGGGTKSIVDGYAFNLGLFFTQFAESFIKMSQIGLKTNQTGNIRTNCRSITP